VTLKESCALVTGGLGFIGGHLVDELMKRRVNVIVLDNLSSGNLKNVADHLGKRNFRLVKGDIRNKDLVAKIVKETNYIFHEAAVTDVQQSIKYPILTNDVNVNGTLNLLRAAMESNIERFVYASSSAVYGDNCQLPIKEYEPPTPSSPYGASKLAAEHYCSVFHKIYGLKTVSLRYFNVYGTRQIYNEYSGVITKFINRVLERKAPLIYGDGKQSRDFIYVSDVVEANMLVAENPFAIAEVFNVGTDKPITINMLAQKILTLVKSDLEPVYESPRLGDVIHNYADISKIKEKLGYVIKIEIDDGLQQLINWYRSQG